MQVELSTKQIHDILEDQYIEQKILQCEAFLDDVDMDEEPEVFNQVNEELEGWIALKTKLENSQK